MASLNELKKLVTMPQNCPFCGTKLSVDNAELDHIIPKSMGGEDTPENMRYVCAKCNRIKANRYNRLFEYYVRLMQNKGLADKTSSKKIDYVLRNMSAQEMDILIERVESKDKSYKRLMAYVQALSKLKDKSIPKDAQPNNDELAEVMNSTLKAYEKYDVDCEERVEINGNTFIYKSGFPIDQYREELASYGEDEQDEIYSVYLDDEGRLVVY